MSGNNQATVPATPATKANGAAVVAQPSYAELLAKVQQLEAAQSQPKGVTFDVGDKGGLMVIGLGRFPVTLYYEQWVRFLKAIGYQFSGTGVDLAAMLERLKAEGKLTMKAAKPAQGR